MIFYFLEHPITEMFKNIDTKAHLTDDHKIVGPSIDTLLYSRCVVDPHKRILRCIVGVNTDRLSRGMTTNEIGTASWKSYFNLKTDTTIRTNYINQKIVLAS